MDRFAEAPRGFHPLDIYEGCCSVVAFALRVSLRHAGMLAGLGVLDRNSLLTTERYGNMVQLGAILVDAELEGGPLADNETCAPGCNLCIEACPAWALGGTTVEQSRCRPVSMIVNARGQNIKGCCACRRACPHALGLAV